MECCLISLKMVTFPSPKPFPKTLTQQLDVFWVHNNGESVGPLSRKFWPFYGLVSKWTWGLNKPLVYEHYKRGNDSLDLGVWGSNFRESPQEIITNLHNIIYIYIFVSHFLWNPMGSPQFILLGCPFAGRRWRFGWCLFAGAHRETWLKDLFVESSEMDAADNCGYPLVI